jgi:hypothetical protein
MARKPRAPSRSNAPSPPPDQPPPRTRQRGDAIPCPRCGGDGFIRSSRNYPGWMRMRYVHCAACGHAWKQSAPRR